MNVINRNNGIRVAFIIASICEILMGIICVVGWGIKYVAIN